MNLAKDLAMKPFQTPRRTVALKGFLFNNWGSYKNRKDMKIVHEDEG